MGIEFQSIQLRIGLDMNYKASELPQTLVILPESVLDSLRETQNRILEKLDLIESKELSQEYLTALEFMEKTKMSRASFDEKRARNEFKVIAKGRKLYVPATEVKRYFEGK